MSTSRPARAILSELAAITVVGLSLSVDADQIRRTVELIEPQIAHVVRLTDEWEPDAVSTLREQLAPVELMCTVGVRDERAIGVARRYAPVCDYLLLDSPHPSTGIVGATGVTHDWALSARIVAAVETPVVLAGGLGPTTWRPRSRRHNRSESTPRRAPAAPTIVAAKTRRGWRNSCGAYARWAASAGNRWRASRRSG